MSSYRPGLQATGGRPRGSDGVVLAAGLGRLSGGPPGLHYSLRGIQSWDTKRLPRLTLRYCNC